MRQHSENIITKYFHISISNQILIAAGFGVFTGIYFGDICKIFAPIGNIYTMLLEVAVYPFLVSTLLSSLGKLSPKISKRLFEQGWPIYVFLVLLTFATLYILTLAFPIITTTLKPTPTGTQTNLLNMVVPDNLFAALAKNYVPAVVLFCILFGIMLQRIKSEQALFKILDTISNACVLFWDWLIKFAPIGIFASIAYMTGTIRPNQIEDVTEYLILFYLGVSLLAFWLLPALISAITDIPYRTILSMLRDALIIAVGTTLSILALPYIYKMVKTLLAKHRIKNSEQTNDIIETTLIVGYPFSQIGNFFVYLFILFATVYSNQPLKQTERLILPFASYLSSIGSPNTTVSSVEFLVRWLQLPPAVPILYDNLTLITDYGQVLVSVMGLAFLTIVVTFACFGLIKLQWEKIFTHIFLVAFLLIIFIHFFKHMIPNPSVQTYQRINAMTLDPALTRGVTVIFAPPFDETKVVPVNNTEDSLTRVQRTGILRVGYNTQVKPFVYLNTQGQVVGYDVSMMFALAQALKCKLEFVPFTWPYLINDLQGNKFDIAIGAIWASGNRLRDAILTDPYIKDANAFIVPRSRMNLFSDPEMLQSTADLRLGTYYEPFVTQLAINYIPNVKIFPLVTADDIAPAFANNNIDIAMWDQIISEVWSLGHPGFNVITVPGMSPPFLFAYMMQKNSPQLRLYINYWLDLVKNEGLLDNLYNVWMLGRSVDLEKPRWSIFNNKR